MTDAVTTRVSRHHQIIFLFFNLRDTVEGYSTWIPPQSKTTSIFFHPAKDDGIIFNCIPFPEPHYREFCEQFLWSRIVGMGYGPNPTN
jgi:hypothetical protein